MRLSDSKFDADSQIEDWKLEASFKTPDFTPCVQGLEVRATLYDSKFDFERQTVGSYNHIMYYSESSTV